MSTFSRCHKENDKKKLSNKGTFYELNESTIEYRFTSSLFLDFIVQEILCILYGFMLFWINDTCKSD